MKFHKVFIVVMLMFAFFSCNHKENKPEQNSDTVVAQKQTIPSVTSLAPVVKVSLDSTLSVHWDNEKSRILKDSLYHSCLTAYKKDKLGFLLKIKDKRETNARACAYKRNLSKGQIAFIFIDEQENLPLFQISGVQLDAFEGECAYPLGYFSMIENNSQKVYEEVFNHLNK